MNHDLEAVCSNFEIPGSFAGAEPYGHGHINDTYVTWWDRGGTRIRTLQQRVNRKVFPRPELIMENIARVTRHLRCRLADTPGAEPERETLTLIPTRDGKDYYRHSGGDVWRSYVFIEGARTYEVCESPAQAREAARAFGRFQKLLADLPGGPLRETIPFFHHTPLRFEQLCRAVERDPLNRASTAAAETDFALQRRALTPVIADALETGALPVRITHNDTKLNNVMLDDRTGRGVCVIDLDTVMSGSSLYDFGDLVRSCTREGPEDQPDSRHEDIFRIDLFGPLVEGYLDSAGDFLLPAEIDALVIAGRLITYTIGLRFLTDYLQGDTYFKINRADQNLDRARVQFRMLSAMERREREMQRIVADVARG